LTQYLAWIKTNGRVQPRVWRDLESAAQWHAPGGPGSPRGVYHDDFLDKYPIAPEDEGLPLAVLADKYPLRGSGRG
jgi:hypothetical protein